MLATQHSVKANIISQTRLLIVLQTQDWLVAQRKGQSSVALLVFKKNKKKTRKIASLYNTVPLGQWCICMLVTNIRIKHVFTAMTLCLVTSAQVTRLLIRPSLNSAECVWMRAVRSTVLRCISYSRHVRDLNYLTR